MTPTKTIAKRIKELRERHGWSAAQLAEQMKRVGVPWERMVVTKLETGRRESISVNELLALAYVLEVAPVHLLVPTDDKPDEPYYPVPGLAVRPDIARAWIRGQQAIGDVDVRRYASQVPAGEFGPDRYGLVTAAHHEAELQRGHKAAETPPGCSCPQYPRWAGSEPQEVDTDPDCPVQEASHA